MRVVVNRYLLPFIEELIVNRTRGEGKGVKKQGGNKYTLAALAESTKRRRKSLKSLHSQTSYDTSNLTMTGDLLDSITATFSNGVITVKVGNDQVKKAGEVEKVRPFMFLSKSELKIISNKLVELITKEIKL